jgi:P2 family phage contractile tail tube protein
LLLPAVLTNATVQFNGSNFSGKVEEIVIPQLSWKAEEITLGGMPGAIEIPVTLEKLTATFKVLEQTYEAYLAAGLNSTGLVTALVTGSVKVPAGSSEPVVCVLSGWIKKIEAGTWKAGDIKAAMQSIELAVWRWSLNRNGVPLVNIDMPNGIVFLGPIDQNAVTRQNLLI